MKSIHRALLATSLLGGLTAQAGTETTASTEEPTSSSTATGLLVGKFPGETAWDRAWSGFTLYKDDNNPILQEFSLQGRLQLQTIYGQEGSDSFNTSDYKDVSGVKLPHKLVARWGDKVYCTLVIKSYALGKK